MTKIYIPLLFIFSSFNLFAQTLFEEDFESGSLSPDWEIVTVAPDGGWIVDSPSDLSSAYFEILSNGSDFIIGSNDDGCNCNKVFDRLITPEIDLTSVDRAQLSFDIYYGDQEFQGDQETAELNITVDGENWIKLKDLENSEGWKTETIDLSEYAGQRVKVAFDYSDGGGWLFGIGLDNISLSVPLNLDAALLSSRGLLNAEIGEDYKMPLNIINNGITEITEIEIGYSVNGGMSISQSFENLSIEPFTVATLNFNEAWVPTSSGETNVMLNVISVNGVSDEDLENNSYDFNVAVFDKVVRPDIVEEIMTTIPNFTEIANQGDQLDSPTDLAFFPIMGKDELWVVNQKTESEGGSTLKIQTASEDPSEFEHQVDGNAWHFMSLPTAISFSTDNHNFATSAGVQDANHGGGSFTGPTLWSSDPAIYAKPSGFNGSHLDMLHGSPFSMGIAHEVDNVFWVYDDWHNDIVRYDFVMDHGPGHDDHSDGIVRRYENIGIEKYEDIPNHMILDKATGWLYFVDNGNSRVMRLDINSGGVSSGLPDLNEPLAEHSTILDFEFEEIIIGNLIRPCGIEMIENKLLVSDYETGDIVIFDMNNNFSEIGRIETLIPGITGIAIGPKGNIWYTNRIENTLVKAEVGDVSSTKDLSQLKLSVYPNPSNGNIIVNLIDIEIADDAKLEVMDITGRTIITTQWNDHGGKLNLNHLESGLYFIHFVNKNETMIQDIIIE